MTAKLTNENRTGDWYLYLIEVGADVDGWRAGHHCYGRRVGNRVQLIGAKGVTAILTLSIARQCLRLCRYADGRGIKVRGQEWQCARWDARRRGVKLMQAA